MVEVLIELVSRVLTPTWLFLRN